MKNILVMQATGTDSCDMGDLSLNKVTEAEWKKAEAFLKDEAKMDYDTFQEKYKDPEGYDLGSVFEYAQTNKDAPTHFVTVESYYGSYVQHSIGKVKPISEL